MVFRSARFGPCGAWLACPTDMGNSNFLSPTSPPAARYESDIGNVNSLEVVALTSASKPEEPGEAYFSGS